MARPTGRCDPSANAEGPQARPDTAGVVRRPDLVIEHQRAVESDNPRRPLAGLRLRGTEVLERGRESVGPRTLFE